MTKIKTTTDKNKLGRASYSGRYLITILAQEEKALEELTAAVTKAGAEVIKTENVGKKTLAYPINKFKELFVISVFINIDPETVKSLESTLKHEDYIERFLLTKWEAELPIASSERTPRARVERD